jgi:hypothetical protein
MSPKHPLHAYLKDSGIAVAALAARAGTTRQTLHRIMRRERAPSMALVSRLVDATGGKVAANDFLPAEPADPGPVQGVSSLPAGGGDAVVGPFSGSAQ